jgi:hypothetical protein
VIAMLAWSLRSRYEARIGSSASGVDPARRDAVETNLTVFVIDDDAMRALLRDVMAVADRECPGIGGV